MRQVVVLATALLFLGTVAGAAAADSGPLADAGLDQTVNTETTVQLDGTGSAHPEGSIVAYEWTIRTPDGREISPDCSDCDRTSFVPRTPGTYEVMLSVTGTDDETDADTLYVNVESGGPSVTLRGETAPKVGESTIFTATSNSTAELESIEWRIDGSRVAQQNLDGATAEPDYRHSFSDTDTRRVEVVVRDTSGRSARDELLVFPEEPSSEKTGGLFEFSSLLGSTAERTASRNPSDDTISDPSQSGTDFGIEPNERTRCGYEVNMHGGSDVVDSCEYDNPMTPGKISSTDKVADNSIPFQSYGGQTPKQRSRLITDNRNDEISDEYRNYGNSGNDDTTFSSNDGHKKSIGKNYVSASGGGDPKGTTDSGFVAT
jgi:hypothetical protein